MKGYVDDTTKIIKKLKELSSTGMSGYSDFVESWLSKNPSYRIDSKEKLNALKTIFSDSHIALIYGSAGTGKSTLINHISNLYNDRKKLYLANTNPAVDNMRRKVNAGNCDFKTIAKFLSDYNTNTECDILFIDECRFLQSNNSNPEIVWGINTYKIGDPVLFNESDRFAPLIYNNMKGRIKDIEPTENKIRFDVELDIAITDWEAEDYDFTLVGTSDNGNSIISFWVDKYLSTDDDTDSSDAIVPFQVAYAVSIHKAQGLEYKSVKIVITNEVEELITHNIFYTAITRAKEDLKIYWTPETEKKILEGLSLRNYKKDAALLAAMQSL